MTSAFPPELVPAFADEDYDIDGEPLIEEVMDDDETYQTLPQPPFQNAASPESFANVRDRPVAFANEGLRGVSASADQLETIRTNLEDERDSIFARLNDAYQSARQWKTIADQREGDLSRLGAQYNETARALTFLQNSRDQDRRPQGPDVAALRQRLDALEAQLLVAGSAADLSRQRQSDASATIADLTAQVAQLNGSLEEIGQGLAAENVRLQSAGAAIQARLVEIGAGALGSEMPAAGPGRQAYSIAATADATFNLFLLGDLINSSPALDNSDYFQETSSSFDEYVRASAFMADTLYVLGVRGASGAPTVRQNLVDYYSQDRSSAFMLQRAAIWIRESDDGIQPATDARYAVFGITENVRPINADAVYKTLFVSMVVRTLFSMFCCRFIGCGGAPGSVQDGTRLLVDIFRRMAVSEIPGIADSALATTDPALLQTMLAILFSWGFRLNYTTLEYLTAQGLPYGLRPYDAICKVATRFANAGMIFVAAADGVCAATNSSIRSDRVDDLVQTLADALRAPRPPWSEIITPAAPPQVPAVTPTGNQTFAFALQPRVAPAPLRRQVTVAQRPVGPVTVLPQEVNLTVRPQVPSPATSRVVAKRQRSPNTSPSPQAQFPRLILP